MSAPRRKYYVVWVGVNPGIYDSWAECKAQILNYPGAKYKSFDDIHEATEAYRGDPVEQLGLLRSIVEAAGDDWTRPVPRAAAKKAQRVPAADAPRTGIAVDGACAGNPGVFEYRGVDIATGAEVFHVGADGSLIGTNNIAEYLALIHVGALLARNGDSSTTIYTDSRTALSWLRRRHSNTKLPEGPETAKTLELMRRADAWIASHIIANPILKWDTSRWGEIPADFGRK